MEPAAPHDVVAAKPAGGPANEVRRMGLMTNESEKPKGGNLEEARLRQQAIGVKLRQMFDDVVNEPVPDDFLDILRKHDERISGSEGGQS
jgi:hypothetical protein